MAFAMTSSGTSLCFFGRTFIFAQEYGSAQVLYRHLNTKYRFKKPRRMSILLLNVALLAAFGLIQGAAADEEPDQGVVSYLPEFFARYQPNSALDMLLRVPGFQIDDGTSKRGFGAAAGNVLINDRYPSAKQDTPSRILERIAADQVARIDLIRGQVRGIDLRRRAVVVSVILHEDQPASGIWQLGVRKNFQHSPLTDNGSLAISDKWKGLDYNAGISLRRFRSGEVGFENVYGAADALLESRQEDSFAKGTRKNVNFNTQTWVGSTVLGLNMQYTLEDRLENLDATSAPDAPGEQTDDFFTDDRKQRNLETGVDAERNLGADLLARAILLFSRSSDEQSSVQNSFGLDGVQSLFRIADSDVVKSESIARLEFDWAAAEHHAVQFDMEAARNGIDSSLSQSVDAGSGPMEVPVPGGNTRVEERRIDVLLSDTWFRGAVELDYGVGVERSTIRQSGDFVNKRNFTFLKPRLSFSYSPNSGRQTRLRLAREVSQLDFSDFISSTVFKDDDLALGNPDLGPESTWLAELSEERRFGELTVIKGTLFYNWISDVEDLLPLSPEFEAPGNIGSGERWGIRLEATLPLDGLGIRSSRLDVEARLQDSTVTDPVTGDSRVLSGEPDVGKPLNLSNENRFAYNVAFRQDLASVGLSWGWNIRQRGDRYAFRVNELVRYQDGREANVFVETSRWFGVKIKLEGLNLDNFSQVRYRTKYTGERGLSPIEVIELKEHTDGVRLQVTVTGSF